MNTSSSFAKRGLSALVIVGLGMLTSGCIEDLPNPRTLPDVAIINTYSVTPENVCSGDTLNFNYRLGLVPTNDRSAIRDSCPTNLPRPLVCSMYYPIFRLSPSSMFPIGLYPVTSYTGSIQSVTVTETSPFTVVSSVDSSSPSWTRELGGIFRLAFYTPSNRIVFPTYSAQIPSFTIDPIDPGQEQPRNVVFSPGSCSRVTDASQPGFQPTGFEWSSIDTSIGQARSASVRLSAICNRDVRAAGSGRYDRTVRFLLGFAPGSGVAAQISEPIAPNQCLVIPSENAPAIVSSVSVIPNRVESLGSMLAVPCGQTGSTPTPPPPVTAELKYVCR